MLKAAVAVSLAIVLATPAYAGWYSVGSDVSHSIWYVDPARVHFASGKVQAWVKINARADRTAQYSEALELLSFDCSAQTYRALSVTKYDSYGKMIASNSVPDNSYGIGYDPVVPDSMAETVERAVCPVPGTQ